MLTFLLWVLFGAFVGWLASLVMARDGEQGTVGNIVVGVIGAALGGYLFQRDVSPNIVSFGSVFTAFVGAVILLALVNLLMRGRVR
jgi:uncharacterized membrane protein YeaQ/YmgE (transglycosylase-associated protein family)